MHCCISNQTSERLVSKQNTKEQQKKKKIFNSFNKETEDNRT